MQINKKLGDIENGKVTANKGIPKIIHQVWEGLEEPLPDFFKQLGETWKENHSDWRYLYWDKDSIDAFIINFFPHLKNTYYSYKYNVQRWDIIRYLFLYKMGGMYVDFDYESLKPIDSLLIGKTCCFAMEPQSHCKIFKRDVMFNNALMACVPNHPFMKRIIDKVFSEKTVQHSDVSKDVCVWKTTGPWALIDLYEKSTEEEKASVYLIPDKYVTPFDVMQARQLRRAVESDELDNCLSEAYAVHFFFNSWLVNEK
jgi:mannosyltransferase OCH1-like enzyme